MQAVPIGQFYFEPVGNVGAGGLGYVDKIRITFSNEVRKPVGTFWARKRLNPSWNQNPEMRARFEREISTLKQLSHPNIVACEGENIPGGERFYLMPYYESSLRKFIAGGSYTGNWRAIAGLAATVASAMAYAHGKGVRHRDLKPENILFNAGGPLIVADWGLGYFVHKHSKVLQQLTRGGMGTEYYCSLEQWSTGKCGDSGDVYSLGMTIDEFATGRQRPITVGMGVDGPSVSESNHGTSRFNALLWNMTRPFHQQRLSSMAAVAREFREIADL